MPIEQLADLAGYMDARTTMAVYRHQITTVVVPLPTESSTSGQLGLVVDAAKSETAICGWQLRSISRILPFDSTNLVIEIASTEWWQ